MRPLAPLVSLLLTALASAQTSPPTTRLEGEVIDARHRPIGNAEVLLEDDGVVVHRTRTDGNGVFVVPRAPARYVLVRVLADGPQVGGELIDLWSGGTAFVRIRTVAARKVSGVVRDDTGAPIANAWIGSRPYRSMPLGLAHCSTRSDEEGRYELSHVAIGSVLVRAWSSKNDAGAFATHFAGTSDHELDCTLIRDDAVWWDITFENATPEQLERATLKVMAFQRQAQMPMPPELARPRAIEPGRWRIAGWSQLDRVHIWAEVGGVGMWPGEHVIKPNVGRTRRRFAFDDPDGEIRGQVHDEHGAPVAGTTLLFQPTQGGGINSQRRSVTTDENGRFRVQSPVATGTGFAARSTSPGVVLLGNAPNPVWFMAKHRADSDHRLEVRQSRALQLGLVTRTGQPVAGATVSIALSKENDSTTIAGGVSALDGSITMRCLSFDTPAKLTVSARGPDGAGEFEILANGKNEISLGTLVLAPAAEVRGQVVDADGNPVSAARVTLSRPGQAGRSIPLTTGREGHFVFRGLAPGNYTLAGRGTNQWQYESILLDDGEIVELDLRVND